MTNRLSTPLILLLLSASLLSAQSPTQTTPSADFAQRMALRLNLSALSVGLEVQPIRKAPISLMAEVGTLHGAYDLTLGAVNLANNQFKANDPYPFLVKARTEVRVYHNWSRRQRLQRSIDHFSGNYITFGYLMMGEANERNTSVEVTSGPFGPQYSFRETRGAYLGYLQLSYGIQRTFGPTKRWFYDFQLGYSYLASEWRGDSSIDLSGRINRFSFNARAAIGLRLR